MLSTSDKDISRMMVEPIEAQRRRSRCEIVAGWPIAG
jgi:hypothetical protein